MKCPTPCYVCGELVELHELVFYSRIVCDCSGFGEGCTHGMCDECLTGYIEDNTDDVPEMAPAECIKCGVATGPVIEVDSEFPGWLCPNCYLEVKHGSEET